MPRYSLRLGIGGSEFPYVLAGMVESWGGRTVDYPERRHCCGFGFRNAILCGPTGACRWLIRVRSSSRWLL